MVDPDLEVYKRERPDNVLVGILPLQTEASIRKSHQRKVSITGSQVESIDSSDLEEEKIPPFIGNVESSLHREYN